MSKKKIVQLLILNTLCGLLTTLSTISSAVNTVPQLSNQGDRRIFFEHALDQLPYIINFLEFDQGFQSFLKIGELREHFQKIKQLIHLHTESTSVFAKLDKDSYGPLLSFNYSKPPSFFRLHPNEPERLAVATSDTKDPIYINMTQLEGLDFDYLDILQILIHEIGHKLGESKIQSVVDQLATQIRLQIAPYYIKKSSLENTLHMISFPSTKRSVYQISDQENPTFKFLLERPDLVQRLTADLSFELRDFNNFIGPHPNPPFANTNYIGQLSFYIADVEIRTVPENTFGYIELNFEAEYENRILHSPNQYAPVSYSRSGQIRMMNRKTDVTEAYHGGFSFELRINRDHTQASSFPWSHSRWDYTWSQDTEIESARVIDNHQVELVLSNPLKHPPFLELEIKEGTTLISAQEESTTSKPRLKYTFNIPSSFDEAIARRVIFNSGTYAPLENILQIRKSSSPNTSSNRLYINNPEFLGFTESEITDAEFNSKDKPEEGLTIKYSELKPYDLIQAYELQPSWKPYDPNAYLVSANQNVQMRFLLEGVPEGTPLKNLLYSVRLRWLKAYRLHPVITNSTSSSTIETLKQWADVISKPLEGISFGTVGHVAEEVLFSPNLKIEEIEGNVYLAVLGAPHKTNSPTDWVKNTNQLGLEYDNRVVLKEVIITDKNGLSSSVSLTPSFAVYNRAFIETKAVVYKNCQSFLFDKP